MRRVQYVVLVLLAALGAGYAQKQAPLAEISLGAGGAPQSISGPIFISVSLTNTSNTQIRIMETNPDKEYRLSVLDDNGEQVPLTPYGKQMSDPQGPLDRNFAQVLQPKGASEMRLDLHKSFDFSRPGKYTVSAKRKAYKMDSNSGIEITSNELAIELTN